MGMFHAILTNLRRGQIPEYELWRQRREEVICLSQSGKSRQCQIANGAGDGHTQQHSWREKAPTSTYSACRDTNGGTHGPMEEK